MTGIFRFFFNWFKIYVFLLKMEITAQQSTLLIFFFSISKKKIENEMKRVFSSHAIPPFFLSPGCSRGLRGGRGLLGQMTRKNVEEKKHWN